MVAGDEDGGRACPVMRHHHLDRLGAARGRQLRPVHVRRLRPEPAVGESAADAEAGHRLVQELELHPEKEFLLTITKQDLSIAGIALVELLSRHSDDEVYLGQRDSPNWTSDLDAMNAFDRFRERLLEVEKNIVAKNDKGSGFKNRTGPVNIPYNLLFPYASGDAEANTGSPARASPTAPPSDQALYYTTRASKGHILLN